MSFLLPKQQSAPPVPPPPPNAPSLAQPSILEAGAQEQKTDAGAEAEGFNGTDVTGGQGIKAPTQTTKTLLGA